MKIYRAAAFAAALMMVSCIMSACGKKPDFSEKSRKIPLSSSSSEVFSSSEDSSEVHNGAVVKTSVTNVQPEKLSSAGWLYNEEDEVYYKLGVEYCAAPTTPECQKLSIYVPAAYMKAEDNGGTFTCTIDESAKVNGFTALNAPIVMPLDSVDYSAVTAQTEYMSVKSYTSQGMVYVYPGYRGKEDGAPAAIADLKAAIKYLRFTDKELAGSAEKIFVFGLGAGGAQAAVLGASGRSEMFTPYLNEIGAARGVSDEIEGVMCWCPDVGTEVGNEAYEWFIGGQRTDLDKEELKLYKKLAKSYANYINSLNLTDSKGLALKLDNKGEQYYKSGEYYNYVKKVIENSLSNFLKDTKFPYKVTELIPAEGQSETESEGEENEPEMVLPVVTFGTVELSGTYNNVWAYINALNAKERWVSYDQYSGKATITSIDAFIKAFCPPEKDFFSYDTLNGDSVYNILYSGEGKHFDKRSEDIISDTESSFVIDDESADEYDYTVTDRMDICDPFYYLRDSEEGYGTSCTAKYWRICTGLTQGEVPLTSVINLANVVEEYGHAESLDLCAVWQQGFEAAERTGSGDENFAEWVVSHSAEKKSKKS